MNTIGYSLLGLGMRLEKLKEKKFALKPITLLAIAFSIATYRGVKIMGRPDPSNYIMAVITVVTIIVTFYLDRKFSEEIFRCKREIYETDKEEYERKKRVAAIRKEGLMDYDIDRKITPPDEEVRYSTLFYAVCFVINLCLIVVSFF